MHGVGALVCALAILLPAASAHATPPILDSVGSTNLHVTASWTLPPGMKTYVVEAANRPETQLGGTSKGFFPDSNRVAVSIFLNPSLTQWASIERLQPGTYYVHVGAYDQATCPNVSLGCELEFSAIGQVVVALVPPTITSLTTASRRLSATWSLPPGTESTRIEVAIAPTVYPKGAAFEGFFLPQNVVASAFRQPTQTSYTSRMLPGGTYWVHVQGRDVDLCAGTGGVCRSESFSTAVPVVMPRFAPVLGPASFDAAGHLSAHWTLPGDMNNDFIEVATSPAVYADGEREGDFIEQNVVLSDLLAATAQTYSTSKQVAVRPGTYYVHVGAYVPSSCSIDGFCDVYEFSDPFQIIIPNPPLATAPKDAVTAFASLRAPQRQSIRTLYVRAAMAEPGTLTASGTVNVPGAARVFLLRAVSATAKPGVAVKLRLVAPRKGLRAARRALRRHRQLRARITITARDASGNTKTERRIVRLTR